MGKTKKKQPVWLVFVRGLGVSLGVYLAGHLLLAALAVRGIVGEESAFSVTAALALAATLCGALTVRRCPLGPLPGGLLTAALFVGVLAAAGGLCWGGLVWAGQGGVLAVFALCGGALAGVLGARRPRSKRRGL